MFTDEVLLGRILAAGSQEDAEGAPNNQSHVDRYRNPMYHWMPQCDKHTDNYEHSYSHTLDVELRALSHPYLNGHRSAFLIDIWDVYYESFTSECREQQLDERTARPHRALMDAFQSIKEDLLNQGDVFTWFMYAGELRKLFETASQQYMHIHKHEHLWPTDSVYVDSDKERGPSKLKHVFSKCPKGVLSPFGGWDHDSPGVVQLEFELADNTKLTTYYESPLARWWPSGKTDVTGIYFWKTLSSHFENALSITKNMWDAAEEATQINTLLQDAHKLKLTGWHFRDACNRVAHPPMVKKHRILTSMRNGLRLRYTVYAAWYLSQPLAPFPSRTINLHRNDRIQPITSKLERFRQSYFEWTDKAYQHTVSAMSRQLISIRGYLWNSYWLDTAQGDILRPCYTTSTDQSMGTATAIVDMRPFGNDFGMPESYFVRQMTVSMGQLRLNDRRWPANSYGATFIEHDFGAATLKVFNLPALPAEPFRIIIAMITTGAEQWGAHDYNERMRRCLDPQHFMLQSGNCNPEFDFSQGMSSDTISALLARFHQLKCVQTYMMGLEVQYRRFHPDTWEEHMPPMHNETLLTVVKLLRNTSSDGIEYYNGVNMMVTRGGYENDKAWYLQLVTQLQDWAFARHTLDHLNRLFHLSHVCTAFRNTKQVEGALIRGNTKCRILNTQCASMIDLAQDVRRFWFKNEFDEDHFTVHFVSDSDSDNGEGDMAIDADSDMKTRTYTTPIVSKFPMKAASFVQLSNDLKAVKDARDWFNQLSVGIDSHGSDED